MLRLAGTLRLSVRDWALRLRRSAAFCARVPKYRICLAVIRRFTRWGLATKRRTLTWTAIPTPFPPNLPPGAFSHPGKPGEIPNRKQKGGARGGASHP